MPGQLGGLVVSLGLNSADFSTGLTKAERDAQLFSDRVSSAILKVGGVLAGLQLGSQFIDATKEIISSAAALQDLAGSTGSSVESLSKLANQATVSGANFDQLKTALFKLSAGMGGVDNESNKVLGALRLLGVTATDPVDALNQVAIAFSKYEDGARKVAFAQAIFGKSGPEFLKVLKDIAETQDIVATTTAKQAEEADKLEKGLRRLSVESTIFKDAILNNVVPSLNTMLEDFREGIKLAGGFFNAIIAFGTLSPFDNVAEGLAKVTKNIEELQALKLKPTLFGDIFGNVERDLKIANAQQEFLKFKQRQEALALISPSNEDARDIRARQRPQLPSLPDRGGGRAGVDRVSEAERFLESLKRQLETTEELTTVEKALRAIQEGRLKGLTPALQEQILGVAAEIDQYKELKKWLDEDRKAFDEMHKAAQEAQRERDKAADSAINSAQKQLDANEALRDEIAIIIGGDAARKALEKQRVQDAINIKEEALALAQLDPLRKAEADAIEVELGALKERSELLKGKDLAEQLKKDAEQFQQFKNIFADSFADAFTSFIDGSKSASDAFKSFAKSVEQQISRLAAQNIANAIFGGNTGGGFDFSKIISAIFGSIGGGSFGGAGGGGGFGTLASGTDNWRGGMTWVGEHGPELVNLPRGASVTPAADTGKLFGPRMNFVVNVLPGANTKTANQAAMMAGIAVQRALAKNG